jgi:hypothetical protein
MRYCVVKRSDKAGVMRFCMPNNPCNGSCSLQCRIEKNPPQQSTNQPEPGASWDLEMETHQ